MQCHVPKAALPKRVGQQKDVNELRGFMAIQRFGGSSRCHCLLQQSTHSIFLHLAIKIFRQKTG
jgi:hypothetical protein